VSQFVVHSAGKCGSRAVRNTLQQAGYNVKHAHVMTGERNPGKCFVITPIRELVRRNVSAYFENCYEGGRVTVDDFISGLEGRHMKGATFFDNRFQPYWGIDVYDTPFNPRRGWKVYEGDGVKALVIRLENFDQWRNAFYSLTGHYPPSLLHTHKTRHAEYRRFLVNEVIPESYYKKMWDTRFMKHFYSDWMTEL